MSLIRTATLIGLVALSAGCNRERPLEGERVALRAPWGGSDGVQANRAQPISLPAQSANASWTQRQGTPGARPSHPALSANPQLIWSTTIGTGDTRRGRLTTDPVVADGRVYTLDAAARVQATSTAGAVLWSTDLTAPRDRGTSASGGSLAVSGGRVYVTSAYAFLAALDAATGAEIWRVDFDAPLTGSPAVNGNNVYVTAIDSSMWSLNAATGRIDWTLPGTPALTTVARGSAPAIAGDAVIFPTQAGELTAVRRSNGGRMWTTVAAGRRTGAALASIPALTGDPVIDGNRLYAANQSGRVFAIDVRSGETLWTSPEGANDPVWPVGGSVFLVSDQNRLMRLDASDGSLIWAQDLPLYTSDRVRRRLAIYPQNGPVLAGGKLWVASGDGVLRGFDPVSGNTVAEIPIPGGAASSPIVAGGVMYILTREGNLLAYR
ncbi:outer membrane protein assembly factor BamB family protein [Pararhodobacter zhoushanensis]|uniref:PQQ-like beta-propeller repeat protein n=1 Tax=Pararhodobacter zhoushanensis TaxID=2479545 RepID=A0ABT3GYG8_9RHOB|nr:PQQ-like beta-propeller repeat protein [Pararhodobacter zhoushanensis]MCW1932588.1 PQQ-like beta-propeller repeat protein [Pararhodobacter zhoushanensis]